MTKSESIKTAALEEIAFHSSTPLGDWYPSKYREKARAALEAAAQMTTRTLADDERCQAMAMAALRKTVNLDANTMESIIDAVLVAADTFVAAIVASASVESLADDIAFAAGVASEYHNMNCLQKCGETDYAETATVGDVLCAIDAYRRQQREGK